MRYRIDNMVEIFSLPELFLGLSLLTVSRIISGVIFANTKFSLDGSFRNVSKLTLESEI